METQKEKFNGKERKRERERREREKKRERKTHNNKTLFLVFISNKSKISPLYANFSPRSQNKNENNQLFFSSIII